MAKVFTITEGLENMGAIKTGGQGSVYKGRRIGEIITAIKILPTPIYSESTDDKNFASFRNEVEKLRKVNEIPNPNVVTILHSGITESGNFPFIEMEYIEGPDLGELLAPPRDPIFTIKNVIKVAEQLSNALAHCHRAGITHGDIKSNNVKFNIKTGNYVLLDFGLSVMSDEQRRTSFRRAGAIEFMAPEQNEGQMFFQTDVYSFGVILFELLTGTVPFPLTEKGETARNNVMLAHMERPIPNILELRRNALPESWSDNKKAQQMLIPEWLINMVYICMEKKVEHRFTNGMELHRFVLRNIMGPSPVVNGNDEMLKKLQDENSRLKQEKENLETLLGRLQTEVKRRVDQPNSTPSPAQPVASVESEEAVERPKKKRSASGIIAVLLPLIALGALGYIYYRYEYSKSGRDALGVEQHTEETGGVQPPRIITTHKNEEVTTQLKYAAAYMQENQYEPALVIYKNLVKKDIAEALYQYGNLALQNINKEIDCTQAIDYLERSARQDYTPAKTTLGFMYAFADQPALLRQNGYEPCDIQKDITKGSKLLMEAMLAGDTTANLLLDELNMPAAEPDSVGSIPQ